MAILDRFRNTKGEIWLNVASSTRILEGFVNLDNHIFLWFLNAHPFFRLILPRKNRQTWDRYREAGKAATLIKHDCRTPLFFPDNSVNHILCSHFLEHVYPVEMQRIIKDFHRALKVNGTIHIIVPDLKEQAMRYITRESAGMHQAADEFIKETLLSKETRGSLKFRGLEFHGGFGLQHRWMYDYSSMAAKLENVGFQLLQKNETPSRNYRLGDGSVHVIGCKV